MQGNDGEHGSDGATATVRHGRLSNRSGNLEVGRGGRHSDNVLDRDDVLVSAEVAEQLNFSQNPLCIDQVVEGIRNLLNRPELDAPALVRVVAVVVVAVLLLLLILAALALALRLLAGLAVVEGAQQSWRSRLGVPTVADLCLRFGGQNASVPVTQ